MDEKLLKTFEKMIEKLNDLEKDVKTIKEQVINLPEHQTEVISKLNDVERRFGLVEIVTAQNWQDVIHLKSIK